MVEAVAEPEWELEVFVTEPLALLEADVLELDVCDADEVLFLNATEEYEDEFEDITEMIEAEEMLEVM